MTLVQLPRFSQCCLCHTSRQKPVKQVCDDTLRKLQYTEINLKLKFEYFISIRFKKEHNKNKQKPFLYVVFLEQPIPHGLLPEASLSVVVMNSQTNVGPVLYLRFPSNRVPVSTSPGPAWRETTRLGCLVCSTILLSEKRSGIMQIIHISTVRESSSLTMQDCKIR